MHITGEFDVNLKPLAAYVKGDKGVHIGRMGIDKTYHGDLNGKSRGEMLSAGTSVKGSAGYVAIEQVNASVQGKTGTFILQHFGIMDRGASRLILEVVPDSGTGELAHISGTMTIIIEDESHYYDFDYTMDEAWP